MTGAGDGDDSLTRWPRLCAFTAGARPGRARVIGPLTLASRDYCHRGLGISLAELTASKATPEWFFVSSGGIAAAGASGSAAWR